MILGSRTSNLSITGADISNLSIAGGIQLYARDTANISNSSITSSIGTIYLVPITDNVLDINITGSTLKVNSSSGLIRIGLAGSDYARSITLTGGDAKILGSGALGLLREAR
jgi:hypothetical protein